VNTSDSNSTYYVTAEEIAAIPLAVLRKYEEDAKENPWRALDEERAQDIHIRNWPPYVFADTRTFIGAAMRAHYQPLDAQEEVFRRSQTLIVLGPWRITRGVYCFDEALSSALAETDPADQIPIDVLLRLPEWAVCIFGKSLSIDGTIVCAFASISHDHRNSIDSMSLLMVHKDASQSIITLQLTPGVTVASNVAKALGNIHKTEGSQNDAADMVSNERRIADTTSRILAHVLYLCANEPDLSSTPHPHPNPRKTKFGPRFFPPENGNQVITVGARFGSMFRRTREEFAAAEQHARTGRTMPPHWRKAHWRSYLTGPRKPGPQIRIVKWIAPTFVNAIADELPVTIRSVS